MRQLLVSELPVGGTLVRLRRAVFVHQADLDARAGAIELTFDGGLVALIRVAGDGESLVIEGRPWAVHFPEPVSSENQEFIWTSGSWEILDVGDAVWSYRQFVGRSLTAVNSASGTVTLDFGGLGIQIVAVADQTRVTFFDANHVAP